MTEYWKSQPRRMCEICKCWMADNRTSIEFHERGNRHKMNVEKKLKESRQKGRENEEASREASATLQEMERAALQTYINKDLCGESGAGGFRKRKYAMATDAVPATRPRDFTAYQTQFIQYKLMSMKKQEQEQEEKIRGDSADTPSASAASDWLAGVSPEGDPYYYNTKTGESSWEQPEGFSDQQQIVETDGQAQENEQKDPVGETAVSSSALEEPSKVEEEKDMKSSEAEDENEAEDEDDAVKPKSGPYGAWQVINSSPQTAVQLSSWKSQQKAPQDQPKRQHAWKSINIKSATTELISSAVAADEASIGDEVDIACAGKEEEDLEEADERESYYHEESVKKQKIAFKEKTFPSDACSVVKSSGEGTAFKKRKLSARKGHFRRTTGDD